MEISYIQARTTNQSFKGDDDFLSNSQIDNQNQENDRIEITSLFIMQVLENLKRCPRFKKVSTVLAKK